MLYELRTYTVKPGTLGDIVKAASTVSRDVRGNNYGKLEGYWFTEIGPLNQVMHMWSYASYDERARLRGELAKNPRWTGEYIPLIRPIVVRQDIRLLNAIQAARRAGDHQAMSTSSATIAASRSAAPSSGLMHSPRCCRRARNIRRSSGSGRPRPESRTKSVTSGPIPA